MGCTAAKPKRMVEGQEIDLNIFTSYKSPAKKHDRGSQEKTNFAEVEHCTASIENINFYYKMGKIIGTGSFGTVR